jgi:hypothetical protein
LFENVVPFQDEAKGPSPSEVVSYPTTRQSVVAVHTTAVGVTASPSAVAGDDRTDHDRPFKVSTSTFDPDDPTAMQKETPTHDSAPNLPSAPLTLNGCLIFHAGAVESGCEATAAPATGTATMAMPTQAAAAPEVSLPSRNTRTPDIAPPPL